MLNIVRAVFPQDLSNVLSLYNEYITSTIADLTFQNNEEEFRQLDEKYSSDESKIFLLINDVDGAAEGCAAFRKVDDTTCEMKRVFLRPNARGCGFGIKLVDRLLKEAALSGYKKICLDVLPEFQAALAIYQSLGFVSHPPITNNPIAGTQFLSLDLSQYTKRDSSPI